MTITPIAQRNNDWEAEERKRTLATKKTRPKGGVVKKKIDGEGGEVARDPE